MLTLVTSNHCKYAPFAQELERLRIRVESSAEGLLEIQSTNFEEALRAKARAAAARFGRPVLVDDAGLVLEAYSPFPGPLTSSVLRSLGVPGLRRLLSGVSDRAGIECHLGCWIGEKLRAWRGEVSGRIDFSNVPVDQRMILSDLFVPDSPAKTGDLAHRARALAAFKDDAFALHLELANDTPKATAQIECHPSSQCPFCNEFEEDGLSVFAEMIAGRLDSRIVYEDEHFVVMPPLGSFMQGGLLLLTRHHVLSFAQLPPPLFKHLERLLGAIGDALVQIWRAEPIIFEHGAPPQTSKGACCVDHAHLNIFPAPVRVHTHLASRMSMAIESLTELTRMRTAEFGYLFVQEKDGSRRVYDGHEVPTQHVRRFIATEMGIPERWHWREYPGVEELVATYHALRGKIRV